MGLLDDAIREHLELKRRRGASAEEVAQQEAEALGPARRGERATALTPPAAAAGTAEAAPPAPAAHVAEPALDEPATAYDDADAAVGAVASSFDDPVGREPTPAPATDFDDPVAPGDVPGAVSEAGVIDDVVAPAPPEAEYAPPAETRLPPAPPPAPAPAAPPAPAADPRPVVDDLQRTQEFSADEVADAAGAADPDVEPGEHDELEETPDFLQETPEHDRLWFEQKPPKDFDF
ncbi:hypothetical protein [Conexibacter sp. SYSU D00693]|uniref:hypothetical protein n=1 Tax=Conexibacter sp. SYSU D00693 TaxID=2812560 RepID=UPI00196ACFF3|nr:hypothetical protein [Conexibacter sp. SYSU D00693]